MSRPVIPIGQRCDRVIRKFIISKIILGFDPVEIFRLWPEQSCDVSTMLARAQSDNEFAQALEHAYSCLYMHRQSELNRISQMSPIEYRPDLEMKDGADLLKRRIDALKFDLKCIAPTLSKLYQRKTALSSHNATVKTPEVMPTISVPSYKLPQVDD